jgi:hypothetical protein
VRVTVCIYTYMVVYMYTYVMMYYRSGSWPRLWLSPCGRRKERGGRINERQISKETWRKPRCMYII